MRSDGLVILQILQGDQAAVGLHRRRQFAGNFALVEIIRAVLLNALQRGGQLRLHQLVADLNAQEDTLGVRELGELSNRAWALQRLAQAIGDRKSVRRQPNRGRQQLGPALVPIFLVRQLEAAHGSWYARSAPSELAVFGQVTAGVQIHVARSGQRSLFAEVDEGGSAIGETGQQEAAASDISREGMRYSERESNRDGCVDGVAAGLEHCGAHVGGEWFLDHYHGMAGVDRLPGVHQRRKDKGANDRTKSH